MDEINRNIKYIFNICRCFCPDAIYDSMFEIIPKFMRQG